MRRFERVMVPAVLVIAAVAAGGIALVVWGDPAELGPAIPALLVQLAAGSCIAALLLTTTASDADTAGSRLLSAGSAAAMTLAALAGAATAFGSAAADVLAAHEAGDAASDLDPVSFLLGDPLGRAWAITALVGVAATIASVLVRGPGGSRILAAVVCAGLLPLAAASSEPGTAHHEIVVITFWMIAPAVAGGLIGIAGVRWHGVRAALAAAVLGIWVGASPALLALLAPELPARDRDGVTPAEYLTGRPLPPAPAVLDLLTSWQFEVFGLATAALLLGGGIRRGVHRGPSFRLVCGVAALALLVWATSGAPGVYATTLVSARLVQLALLALLVPALLVVASPPTSAPRSRAMRFLTHPLVAATVWGGVLVLAVRTDLLLPAAANPAMWMVSTTSLVGSGLLLCVSLRAPGPRRRRLVAALAALLALGIAVGVLVPLIVGDGLLHPEWFAAMGRTWGWTAVDDQRFGAGIALVILGAPLLVLAAVSLARAVRTRGEAPRPRAPRASRPETPSAYDELLARRGR
ncbi:cytochrome c oxidase assembly protein [Homoserinibacter sp. GY 40078]|uniref:cytochrome c oxidase assembly protein n=1 Tax=Homoserinibacter sp. GY 40078 TaxID=2603275 RepID=UPI00164FCA6E|nr:cytochrome c oxidase assembly protein [Homoserinibacter sp. GY 40078]